MTEEITVFEPVIVKKMKKIPMKTECDHEEVDVVIESNYESNRQVFSKYFEEIKIQPTIEEDNIELFDKFFMEDLNPSYLGGLIDGDGYVYMNGKDGYTSGVSLTQCRTNILRILQHHFGGVIYKDKSEDLVHEVNEDGTYSRMNRRRIYSFVCRGILKKYFVDELKKGIILKENQIDILIQLREYENRPNFYSEKFELCEKMRSWNQKMEKPVYDFSKMNIYYIAGLFDAEGFCYLSKSGKTGKYTRSVYMKITQKNHPDVIDSIVGYLGFGKNDGGYIYVVSGMEETMRFIEMILPHLIVKKNEVMILKNYIETKNYTDSHGYDEKIGNYRHYLAYLMSKEKHENEDYDPENDEESYIRFIEKIEAEKELEKQKREERKIEVYREKSENMMGDKNHNFGKELSDETKQKMAISIAASRRGDSLTDENIEMIRHMRKDKLTQQEIIEQFQEEGMSLRRDAIRMIQNGSIKTIQEMSKDLQEGKKTVKPTKPMKGLSHEEKTAIGKRSVEGALNFYERLEIMMIKRDLFNKKSERYLKLDTYAKSLTPAGGRKKQIGIPLISTYLSREFSKNVSEHIIKNMWDGRGVLYDAEFNSDSPITYQEYNDIIQMKFK
jgi:hypothetical protein